MIFPNKKLTLTVKKAGEFDYYCKFHPNMTGHITVKP
jgi:plastocyanin